MLKRHQAYAVGRMQGVPFFWLCDKPGLGKTYSAIATMRMQWTRRFIWVTKKSMLQTTLAEIELRAPLQWNTQVLTANEPISRDIHGIIVPWSLLQSRKMLKHIRTFARGFPASTASATLILDESHMAKQYNSLRTQQVFGFNCLREGGLIEYFEQVICLTGTPVKVNAADLYPSLRAMTPFLIEDTLEYESFVAKYCIRPEVKASDDWKKRLQKKRAIVGTNNKTFAELSRRMAPYVLCRHPEHVLPDLPPLTWRTVPLENFSSMVDFELEDSELEPAWATRRRELGLGKLASAAEYTRDLIDSGSERVLVFAHHKEVIDVLTLELRAGGIDAHKIHGGTTDRAMNSIIPAWQDVNSEMQVLVLQMDKMGEGNTLHAHGLCRDVVFAELSTSPLTLHQCAKRAHRIGQPNSVNAHLLCTEGTVEMQIGRLLEKRLRTLFVFEQNAAGAVDVEGISLYEEITRGKKNAGKMTSHKLAQSFPEGF